MTSPSAPTAASWRRSYADGAVLDLGRSAPGRLFRQLEASPELVASSPDATTLAVAARSGAISLWTWPRGRCGERLAGHTDIVWGMNFSADGKTLASGGDDRTAIVWDVASGDTCARRSGATPGGYSASPSALTVGRLYTGGLDGTVDGVGAQRRPTSG